MTEPAGFLEMPEDTTPQEVVEVQAWWNAGGSLWASDDGSGELLADGARLTLPSGKVAIFHRFSSKPGAVA